ncbi:Translin [Sparassis latifolia]
MSGQSMPEILNSRDSILQVFDDFRDELDGHNDRRERLIKSSRDVTNLSKKVIFLLHRTMTEENFESNDHVLAVRAAGRAKEKLREIQNMFAAIREEVAGDRFWRYQKNVSPGLQEYIEALSFAHFLEHGTLISYDEVQQSLCDNNGIRYFPLPLEDYLLGLSDLTGELMRYAISAISRRGGRSKASEVCTFVRGCRANFEGLVPYYRELRKKQAVTSQSLEKIEDVAYAIAVRSSEYDLPPEILDDIVARTVSSAAYSGSQGDRRRKGGRGSRGHDDELDDGLDED